MVPCGTSHVGCYAAERVLQVFGSPSRHRLARIKVGRGYAFDQGVKRFGIDLQVSSRVGRTKEPKGTTKYTLKESDPEETKARTMTHKNIKNAFSFGSHLRLMIDSDFIIYRPALPGKKTAS